MKPFIISALLIVITANVFGQQTTSLTKTDYLQKSKRQKTTAWIMLGGGVATTITGIVIYDHAYNKAAKEDPLLTLFSLGTNVNPTGAIISLVGSLASVASIPLFIASSKNKRTALLLSLKNERIPHVVNTSIAGKSFPAVSLKINL